MKMTLPAREGMSLTRLKETTLIMVELLKQYEWAERTVRLIKKTGLETVTILGLVIVAGRT